MKYIIIPEYNNLSASLQLTSEYDASWEYNDFTSPKVYEDMEEINRRIQTYRSLGRDLSQDTMHGAFLGIDIAAVDPVFRSRSQMLCEQSLQIAEQMGIRGVVYHTGLIGGLRVDYYLDHWLDVSTDFWSRMSEKYPSLSIFIENSFEQEPDMLIRLMEKMKDVANIKLCLDYGHAVLTQTPVEQWCETMAPYIGHMHLNDNDLKVDLHLAIGQGKVDFQQYRQMMERYKIDVPTLLEVNGMDKIEKSLQAMRKMV